ncbi:MAG: GNAT family N-acetyltransferase [Flammeovirgaceae bacterium]
MSPSRLDKFLAGGWFRNCHLLFRSQLICLEGDVFSVVNIRLNLEKYNFSKSLRKIYRRNLKRFTFEIRHMQLDREKEQLFQKHRSRFKGFLFESLQHFFSEDLMGQQVFDTKEICVYDKEQLIAYSFFDEGQNSMASLLGVFDERYSKYSLGLFTMLLEIIYASTTNKQYYYPGYVLDQPSVFDYKLRLGEMEYYNWKGEWLPKEKITFSANIASRLRSKIAEMQLTLSIWNVANKRILYPVFSLGYLGGFEGFVKSPIYLACYGHKNKGRFLIVEYLLEEKTYALSLVEKLGDFDDMINMNATDDFLNEDKYCIRPLCYEKTLAKETDPNKMAAIVSKYVGVV